MAHAGAHYNDCQLGISAASDSRQLQDWAERLSTVITEMRIDVRSLTEFRAGWRHIDLGPLALNFLEATPQQVRHTTTMARDARSASYDLIFFRSNGALLQHCGRNVRLVENDFVLLDNLAPYDLRLTEHSVAHTVHLEDTWLRRWVPNPRSIVAEPIANRATWGAPLAALLETIYTTGLHGVPVSRSDIADQLGALIALMAGAGADNGMTRHHEHLLAEARRMLHERLADSDLTPTALAAALGVSKRHLHGVFSRAGTTFGATLMHIRMRNAARLLTDPHRRHQRISELAALVGFDDPSHFARVFRQHHGVPPTRYRAEHAAH